MSLTRSARVALAAALAFTVASPGTTQEAAAPPAPQPDPVADSGIEERVDVQLVELVVRIADRQGRAIPDVRADEIRVLEGGRERRVAYLAPIAAGGPEAHLGEAEDAAVLYDASGEAVRSEETVVVRPPKSQRRVFLVFDVANSKFRSRDNWRDAALLWVQSSMLPDDRVGIAVLKNNVRWLQRPTSEKAVLLEVLKSLDLVGYAPDRDRREQMSQLVDELEACADVHRSGGALGRRTGSEQRSIFESREAEDCAFRVSEPWAEQWDVEAEESALALRALVGQLAAIEGRKEVLLFSEGLIPDASQVATEAMVGIFGSDTIRMQVVQSRFARDSLREIDELHRTARAAGVVFHTFDTRSAGDRGYYDTREYASAPGFRNLGINPWAEMYDSTNGSVAALAHETGGRTARGTQDLPKRVREAAEGFFGVYNLGFYRDDDETGKVRVEVARKGVKTEVESAAKQPWTSRPASLELFIRPPEPGSREGVHAVPVVFQMPLGELPLRKGGGEYGCEIALFLQAARPDGTVVGEAFFETVVALDPDDPKRRDPSTAIRQLLRVDVPPGSYRLFARVSDDRQIVIARRTVDITVDDRGQIRGGL